MGAKGKRRREKNFKAAHGGGFNVLPPPPVPSSIEALPSKLRTLMSLTHSFSPSPGSAKVPSDIKLGKKRVDDGSAKKLHPNDVSNFKTSGIKEGHNDQDGVNDGQVLTLPQQDYDEIVDQEGYNDEIVHNNSTHEKKKKRKRKQVNDLRFEEAKETLGIGSKRKERKKKHLQEMKKKSKKAKTEETLEFPGREEIRFGDVVEAPPKLVIPKALKTAQNASKERLRLQAVEDYRKRKGWVSRPGINLPPPVTTSTLI